MLVTSIFSFSHNVFLFSSHEFQFLSHYDFVVCKCFEFGQGQNFAFGKELNCYLMKECRLVRIEKRFAGENLNLGQMMELVCNGV